MNGHKTGLEMILMFPKFNCREYIPNASERETSSYGYSGYNDLFPGNTYALVKNHG